MTVNAPEQGNNVYVSNKEIYDMVLKLQNKVSALMTMNGLLTAIITYLVVEGLK